MPERSDAVMWHGQNIPESLNPESERNDRKSAGNKSVTYPAPVVLDFHKAVKANN
ncbi:MAG: hypothetical protein KA165_06640 [Saprospiraceae bacterium]|nr:hypothetical protein [Saprospiraceae bacterium]